jgi:translocation and assembly module TamB
MARRLLWALFRLLILIPLWLLGLAVLVIGLALSPWGTGLLLEEGAKRGFYELDRAQGAPLDTLVLQNLRLEAGPALIAAERVELAWADDCVLSGRLCLDALLVEGVRVRLSQGEPSEGSDAPPGELPESLRLPFPVEIRSLALLDVEVQLADGTRLRWEHFSTGAVAEGSTIALRPTRLAGIELLLPLSAGARLALSDSEREGAKLTAEAIDAATAARSPLPAGAAAELEGLADLSLEDQPRRELPEIRLPLRVEVPELLVESLDVSGAAEYGVERLALSLTAEGHVVEITPLEVASRDADARLQARVELRDDYPLQARFEVAFWLPEVMPALAGQHLDLALDGSLADLVVRLGLSGPVTANLDARLDALDPTLPFTAALQSDLLQWPLPGTSPESADDDQAEPESVPDPYLVEDLTLRLEGSLLAYRVAASLMAEGPELPYTRLALTGTGDQSHFAWTPLAVSLGEASAVSRGRVDWAEALAVEALVRLDKLDPGEFVEGLQGRLTGNAELAFAQSAQGWELDVPRIDIDGELQELPLSLRASLSGDSEMRWQIDTLEFRQGDNRVSAAGRVSETSLDVAGELDLPALANLHDELGGNLSGSFAASGTLEAPQLDIDLSGAGLGFAENRLETLRLVGQVSGLDDPALDMDLGIQGLDAGGQRFREIALTLDGRLSDHRLSLDVRAEEGMPLGRAALVLQGAMGAQREAYQGRITPLEVSTDYGEIRLVEALAFDVDLTTGSARVAPFCLRRGQGGELCLEAPLQASAESGEASLAIRDLPLSLIREAIPENWDLTGTTNAELTAEWGQGGARWLARLGLRSELALSGLDAYGQPWELPASRFALTVEADQGQADIDLSLALAESGELGLVLSIIDPLGVGTLDGRLTIDDLSLSRYRTLVAGMDTFEGSLGGDVRIGGNRESPSLDGRIGLDGLRLSGGDIPLQVRDGELEVRLSGERGEIDGFLAAEEGRLLIDGEASWPDPRDWRVAVALDARQEPLLAVLPGFGRLRVAPDIQVRVTPERLQVRGQVRVPWARLEVGERPPAAVSPSPDEVIITRRDDERARQRQAEQDAARRAAQAGGGTSEATIAQDLNDAGMAVDVQIDLVLGPDMQLEAYGLESGLSGTLEVRQQDGPVQLFGDVNLEEGRFQAFGQDLLIREGQLLFSGPPDQPLLNFEAIRNPSRTQDGVIAGLRVTGSASDPQLRVFSEPAMEQARALSYLLRGRGPEGGGTDDALASALLGLTLGRTGGAVGAFGQAFGVDDLALETAGAGDESQVVVSGQLSDDLRVSYGVGVFTPIAELTLRYNLWRNLYLEAVSGAAQAVDLVYTFSLPGNPVVQ